MFSCLFHKSPVSLQTLYTLCHAMLCCAKSLHVLTLCDPMDCSLPGSSVHEILQARILEWVVTPSYIGSSQPGIELVPPALAGRFLTTSATWETFICNSYLQKIIIHIVLINFILTIIVQITQSRGKH